MNNGFEYIFEAQATQSPGKSSDEKNMKKNFDNLAWRNKKPLTFLQKEENKEILLNNLDRETELAMKKKSWNLMDMCFKWRYILNYLENLGINEKDSIMIKDLFIKKQLTNIIFNSKEKKITSLSIDWNGMKL